MPCTAASPQLLRHRYPATPDGVRSALVDGMRKLVPLSLSPEDLAAIELVLAELLNNVAEHAYGGSGRGELDLSLTAEPDALAVMVTDEGAAMPGGPAGPAPAPPNPAGLPEGGFGWMLIRAHARDIVYRRSPGRNRLCLRILTGRD
ncbi:MAG: ATP-binding protein [Tranquillimonas sp.]|jgi:serine/threonine-protein kinase RsbW